MYGESACGFWQSKDRYKSDDDLLRIAKEYRSETIHRQHRAGLVLVGAPRAILSVQAEAYSDVSGTGKEAP